MMRIVVDTNIVFSAVLNSNSRIANIILKPSAQYHFYSIERLITEIKKHKGKLSRLSGYNDIELDRMIDLVVKNISFINTRLIPPEIYDIAEELTYDVDEDDTEFVALTEFVNGKLWSGDKKLQKGLIIKKWNKFISTEELLSIV